MQEEHEKYMLRCLQLARLGAPTVSPNPMVGSVIVHAGNIIGEGWHYQAGQAHAEVNAINRVKNKDLLKESTLYVNLEPCSHFGRTPPCSNLIIEKQIPRVVIGCRDINSAVNGKGIERLKNAGIEVTENILAEEAAFLNRRFFTFHGKKRPFVLLKWAQSSDAYMDISRKAKEKGIFWISSPNTRPYVHAEREKFDAILVGANTVINDNPHLGISEFKSAKKLLRVIIDPEGEIEAKAQVFRDDNYLYFSKYERQVKTHLLSSEQSLKEILEILYNQGIQSLMVEGGGFTLNTFIKEQLWDEALVITAPKTLNDGLKAPQLNGRTITSFYLGEDKIERISAL